MSMGLVKSAYIKENFGGNKMFKKLKDKKGFTLVELIVVLVILAILAALLVPALTGYIDKANKNKIVSECRQIVVAAQTEVSEAYGKGTLKYDETASASMVANIKKLAEAKSDWTANITVLKKTDETNNVVAGTVIKVQFSDGTNSCTYKWNATNNEFEYVVDTTAVTVTDGFTGVDALS